MTLCRHAVKRTHHQTAAAVVAIHSCTASLYVPCTSTMYMRHAMQRHAAALPRAVTHEHYCLVTCESEL